MAIWRRAGLPDRRRRPRGHGQRLLSLRDGASLRRCGRQAPCGDPLPSILGTSAGHGDATILPTAASAGSDRKAHHPMPGAAIGPDGSASQTGGACSHPRSPCPASGLLALAWCPRGGSRGAALDADRPAGLPGRAGARGTCGSSRADVGSPGPAAPRRLGPPRGHRHVGASLLELEEPMTPWRLRAAVGAAGPGDPTSARDGAGQFAASPSSPRWPAGRWTIQAPLRGPRGEDTKPARRSPRSRAGRARWDQCPGGLRRSTARGGLYAAPGMG